MSKRRPLTPTAIEDLQRHQALDDAIVHLRTAITGLPAHCRPCRGNALLNLALGCLIEQYGQAGTAQLLARVEGALSSRHFPDNREQAFDPFRLDG